MAEDIRYHPKISQQLQRNTQTLPTLALKEETERRSLQGFQNLTVGNEFTKLLSCRDGSSSWSTRPDLDSLGRHSSRCVCEGISRAASFIAALLQVSSAAMKHYDKKASWGGII